MMQEGKVDEREGATVITAVISLISVAGLRRLRGARNGGNEVGQEAGRQRPGEFDRYYRYGGGICVQVAADGA